MNYMEENVDLFLPFFDEVIAFDSYIGAQRLLGSWGGDHELESMRRLFNFKLEIYIYDATLGAILVEKNITQEEEEEAAEKKIVTLSYFSGRHYDSIVVEVILTHTHSYSLVSLIYSLTYLLSLT